MKMALGEQQYIFIFGGFCSNNSHTEAKCENIMPQRYPFEAIFVSWTSHDWGGQRAPRSMYNIPMNVNCSDCWMLATIWQCLASHCWHHEMLADAPDGCFSLCAFHPVENIPGT